jgi:hypothetical protein
VVRRLAPIAILISLSLAACGSADEQTTPAWCKRGPEAFDAALRSAPAPVRLPGGVAISDCLVRNQSAGDLADLGTSLVALATGLNSKARTDPGGPETVELGYLVGAVTRGAGDTSGIHAELQRRIEAAALYSPAGKPPPEPFDHAYQKGYAAGKEDG